MKMIKTLNLNTSVYAGKKKNFTEMTLKPTDKTDPTTGEQLPPSRRYYVVRPLSFEHGDRVDYPFIIRDEHVFYQRNSEGKVVKVEKICCPSTSWASQQLIRKGETIGRGYCPICDFSFNKNKIAWANRPNVDSIAAKLAQETKSVWAAYLPVFVVNDPNYASNNQHLRVIRITDKEGFTKIVSTIEDALNKGINVFNGDEGANLWILVEANRKNRLDKNGKISINKKTNKPYEYISWDITDVRVITKKLYSYPMINDDAIDELAFDDTYGVASTKFELQSFLNRNWLDIGASDADFADEFEEMPKSVSTAVTSSNQMNASTSDDDFAYNGTPTDTYDEPTDEVVDESAVTDGVTDDDFDMNEGGDNVESMISGIIGNSNVRKTVEKTVAAPKQSMKRATMSIRPSAEAIREDVSTSIPSFDDLPF
jgi:hypothetical protein